LGWAFEFSILFEMFPLSMIPIWLYFCYLNVGRRSLRNLGSEKCPKSPFSSIPKYRHFRTDSSVFS